MYLKLLFFCLGLFSLTSLHLSFIIFSILLVTTICIVLYNIKKQTELGQYQISILKSYEFALPISLYLSTVLISEVVNYTSLDLKTYILLPFIALLLVMSMMILLGKLFNIRAYIFGVGIGIAIQFFAILFYRDAGLFNIRLTTSEIISLYSICLLYILLAKLYKNRTEMLFLLLSFNISFVSMVLLISRTAFFIYILAIIALCFFFLGKRALMLTLFLLAPSIFLLFKFAPGLLQRYKLLLDLNVVLNPRGSFGNRLYLWDMSVDIFLSNPIVGIGTYNFQNAALYISKYDLISYYHTHNTFLHHLVSFGILGAIAFLFLILKFALFGYKSLRYYNIKLGFLWLTLLAIFLCNGLTEVLLVRDEMVTVVFASLLGILYSLIVRDIRNRNEKGSHDKT